MTLRNPNHVLLHVLTRMMTIITLLSTVVFCDFCELYDLEGSPFAAKIDLVVVLVVVITLRKSLRLC